ncbi:MAG: dihydrofolate reductase family protein [Bauldia sp.]
MFGRIPYELMARYWPTPLAAENDPVVAERMNTLPKVVFSRTLEKATWNNTKLMKGNIAAEVGRMKKAPGPGMVIFGSGTIVAQLADQGLIDEFQIVVNPVALGAGKTMFAGIRKRLDLKRTAVGSFANGNVVLSYEHV